MINKETFGHLLMENCDGAPQEGWACRKEDDIDQELIFAIRSDAGTWAEHQLDPSAWTIVRVMVRGSDVQEVQPPD
jgi:hypothetical protein